MRTVYLDHTSSTTLASSARDTMWSYLNRFYGHPDREHWQGRAAAEALEDARESVARLLQCHASEIHFTAGGTEAINMALLGVGRAISNGTRQPHIIATALDHPCVHDCVAQLEQEGWISSVVGCTPDGVVSLDELKRAIHPATRIITVPHVNPRTGAVQPVEEIARLCRRHDVLLHIDACLSVGRVEIAMNRLDADLLSISAHKFHGPQGVGALFLRAGVPINSLLASKNRNLRPGTPAIPLIIGLGAAASFTQSALQTSHEYVEELRQEFLRALREAFGPENLVIEHVNPRGTNVPGILSIEMPGVDVLSVLTRLKHICFGPPALYRDRIGKSVVRCVVDPIYQAMGWNERRAANTLQASFGWSNTTDEIRFAARAIGTEARQRKQDW